MRIARFDTLVRHIRSDRELAQTCRIEAIFRRFEERWLSEAGEGVADPPLAKRLEYARGRGAPWRASKSSIAFFPLQLLDLVVVAKFGAPPREPTTRRVRQVLEDCVTRSQNEFNAKHHPLTGLLNREGIDDLIASWENDDADRAETSQAEQVVPAAGSGLIVLALDVDRFKQVNDSYGHEYGDAVLWVVGRRLDAQAAAIRAKLGARAEAAHPSGEEFFVFVNARLPEKELIELADQVRSAIDSDVLPNDVEWPAWTSFRSGAAKHPPALGARNVTVSVGVSSSGSAPADALDQLKREADIALYRAKASGRNCVCYFHEIRIRHGRVLEHQRKHKHGRH